MSYDGHNEDKDKVVSALGGKRGLIDSGLPALIFLIVFNISGKEQLNVLQIVEKVADYYHLDKSLIRAISSKTLNQRAKRPPITGFILTKAIRELGYKPHSFEEGIAILDHQMKTHSA